MNNKPWFCQECLVVMVWVDDICFRCPVCGVEVWPPDPPILTPEEEVSSIAEEEAGKNDDFFLIPKKAGGGSRTKGRKDIKRLLGKKTTKKLYDELCK